MLQLQKQGSQSPTSRPATASLSSEQSESQPAPFLSAHGDADAEPQEPKTSTSTEEAEESPIGVEPPDSPQQLSHDLHSVSTNVSQQQQGFEESEALQTTKTIKHESTDHAAPSAPNAQTADKEQHDGTNLDSFGSLIETRPDSNGNTKTLDPDEADVPASSIVEPTSPGTAVAGADDKSDDAQSLGGASTQSVLVHHDQQQQQPQLLSGLYLSSQVDQSSRNSLRESVQSAGSSLQQPAISSNVAEASEVTEAVTAIQPNGIVHEGGESAAELAASASQQSSEDNHEQQAHLPGKHLPLVKSTCLSDGRCIPCCLPPTTAQHIQLQEY